MKAQSKFYKKEYEPTENLDKRILLSTRGRRPKKCWLWKNGKISFESNTDDFTALELEEILKLSQMFVEEKD